MFSLFVISGLKIHKNVKAWERERKGREGWENEEEQQMGEREGKAGISSHICFQTLAGLFDVCYKLRLYKYCIIIGL